MVLGKIAIVIGSGIVGTLVTGGDAGKLPDLRDVLSVSFKFMTKQDKKEGSSAAASPHTDQLLSQVNYLREQLRVLSDQKEMPHIIINGRPGAGAYGLTAIALGALGYLYIRWKGWKIADLMFVTKRGLSDACNVVGKQLDQVSESVHAGPLESLLAWTGGNMSPAKPYSGSIMICAFEGAPPRDGAQGHPSSTTPLRSAAAQGPRHAQS